MVFNFKRMSYYSATTTTTKQRKAMDYFNTSLTIVKNSNQNYCDINSIVSRDPYLSTRLDE